MSQDFTTNLLESIKKSEVTTVEKQRKIQECVEAVEGLSVTAQASENTCRNLKQEIEDFKDRNAMKKAEKDLRLTKPVYACIESFTDLMSLISGV